MATLRDVALRAGVSVGSVSAVINGRASVSSRLRQKILAAITELDYSPDAVARSLKMGRTETIGLLVSDITNPHFSNLARVIERACEARGYMLVLGNTDEDPEKELRHLDLMRRQRVDGIILDLAGTGSDYAARVKNAIAAPAVAVDRTIEGVIFDTILLDNRAASRMLVEHLVHCGHRRIGMIAGRSGVSTSVERLAGFREALQEHGIEFDERLVVPGFFQIEPAYQAMTELLHRHPRPTAVLSANNLMTIGAMQALAAEGFRCPRDIAVVGIDDFPWSSAFIPRLTAISQPIEEIGRIAAARLFGRLRGEIDGPAETIIVNPTLTVRDSVTPGFQENQRPSAR